MRTIPLFGIGVLVLGAALAFSPASAQNLPLLSPLPTEMEDPVTVAVAWSAARIHPAGNAVLAVVLDIRDGYHIMADRDQQGQLQDFQPFPTRVWVSAATDGVLSTPPHYPKAHPLKVDFTDARIMGFEKRAVVYVPIRADLQGSAGEVSLKVGVEYQACAATYCLMPQRIIQDAALPLAPAHETVSAVNPELFQDYASLTDGRTPANLLFRFFGFDFTLDPAAPLTAALILLLAALGGFLLNFTPCVLPLIPIKLISLSNAAADRRRCLTLGLFTFAGVLAFWIILGGIVTLVSDFTSMNQLFQYPAFTIGVGLVIAAMAVGMFGVYSVRLPGVIYALNPRQETLSGALGTGVLTAVLSTPCTAPFMGTAAAWATTQEPLVTIATFSAIGAGMGLPSLLAAFPRLVRRMPKSGPGSELLKQAMAILMLAAAAYFIGIGLGTLLSDPAAPVGRQYWWPVMILCAAAGAWVGLRAASLSLGKRARAFWAAVGTAVVAVCLYGAVRLTDTGPIAWASYTPERLARAFQEYKTVVMIFTAEWCLNCKALEQSVWGNPALVKLVSDPAVAPIKVDLTGNNPEGRNKLQEARSLTIPLLMVIRPDGGTVFRSDFYTADQVAAAIRASMAGSLPKP
jgi:thiol:disulfide interchange protein DsbD